MKSANGAAAKPASDAERRHDVDLIERMAAGDQTALTEFYDRYSSTLYGVATKILNDFQEAEAALQAALVNLWHKAGSYQRDQGSPFSWAVTSVRSEAIDRLRLRGRSVRDVIQHASVAEAGERPALRELRARAVSSLARLPKEQREALQLTFFGGLTHQEVANQLGIPLDAAKGRTRRGLILMRKLISARND